MQCCATGRATYRKQQMPELWMEGTEKVCGSFCSLKLPYLSTMSLRSGLQSRVATPGTSWSCHPTPMMASLLVPLPLYLSASLPPELCPLRFVFSVYIWHRTCKLEEFINNGLTPLEKCKFFDDIEMTFFPTVYSVLYCSKSVSTCSDWKQWLLSLRDFYRLH